MRDDAPLWAEQLIHDAAAGTRRALTARELLLGREYVADAGFSPTIAHPADSRVVGLTPPSGGAVIRRGNLVNVGELH